MHFDHDAQDFNRCSFLYVLRLDCLDTETNEISDKQHC